MHCYPDILLCDLIQTMNLTLLRSKVVEIYLSSISFKMHIILSVLLLGCMPSHNHRQIYIDLGIKGQKDMIRKDD